MHHYQGSHGTQRCTSDILAVSKMGAYIPENTWNLKCSNNLHFCRHPNLGLLICFSWFFSRVCAGFRVRKLIRSSVVVLLHRMCKVKPGQLDKAAVTFYWGQPWWAAKLWHDIGLDCWSVMTILLIAPCNNWLICHNRSKCSRFKPQCGLNLLYMPWICCTCLGWSWTAELSLPSFHLPKAQQMPVVWICCTCFRWSWTAELSLPSFHLPKAQQMPVVWICCTCFRWSWTAELSLPSFHLPKAQQMQQIQTTAWSESAVHA